MVSPAVYLEEMVVPGWLYDLLTPLGVRYRVI
jgi:hypothetical protein